MPTRQDSGSGSKRRLKTDVAEAFPRLTREQVAAVASEAKLQTFTTGETVIREGSYANGFFVIVSGQAEVLQFDDANKYVRLRRLSRGDFFGEIGLLTQPRRTATVRAKTKLEVVALRNDQFFALLQDSPSTATVMRAAGTKRAARPRPKAKGTSSSGSTKAKA